MKALATCLLTPVFALMPVADRSPTEVMATLLLTFTHRCTPNQCATLEAIAGNTAATVEEHTLAQALLGVDHRLHPSDAPRLRAIMADRSQPELVRVLAEALLRVVHVPAEADRAAILDLLRASNGHVPRE